MKKIYILTIGVFCLCISNSYSQWVAQSTGAIKMARGIRNISIVDANTAWVSMYDGTIGASIREFSKTTDGGKTWTLGVVSLASAPTVGFQINQIAGVSATAAYAVLSNEFDGGGAVFKTLDGGLTWTKTSSLFPTPGYANCVYFWDATTGVALGDPRANFWPGQPNKMFEIFTTNNGVSWDKKESPLPIADNEYGQPSVMAVNGDHIWFGTIYGRIYHSPDKGYTWTVGATPIAGSVTSIAFQDANTGFATVSGYIYKTTDGGATWSIFNNSGSGWPYTRFTYVPGTINTYFSVSDNPSNPGSSYSLDGGDNWVQVADTARHTCVAFFNSNTGWSGGFTALPGTDGIFKWAGPELVGVFEHRSNRVFSLYPNPSNGTVNLHLEGKSLGENIQVEIFDIIGNKVIAEKLTKSTSPIELNVTNLPGGTYFIKVSDGKREHTEKFVKF